MKLSLINKKLYTSMLLTLLVPFIYSTLRIFWISDDIGLLINASAWIYISLFTEIVMLAAILPIYKYVSDYKNDQDKINRSIFSISLSIVFGIIFFLVVLAFLGLITDAIYNVPGNDAYSWDTLYQYLLISLAGEFFRIMSMMITSALLVSGETWNLLWVTFINLLILVSTDLIFISDFAVLPNDSLMAVGISTLTAPFVTMLFFGIFYYIRWRRYIPNSFTKNNFRLSNVKKYFKLSSVIALEAILRNAFYAAVTLQINNSISVDAVNSWNLSMYLWFTLFNTLTYPISQAAIVDFSDKKKDQNKLFKEYTILSIATYIVILAGFYPANEFLLPWVSNNAEFTSQAQEISWMILPFFFMMSYVGWLNQRFIAQGKVKLYLIQTTVTQILVMVPAAIIFYLNIYDPSLMFTTWLFNASIAMSFISTTTLTYIDYTKKGGGSLWGL